MNMLATGYCNIGIAGGVELLSDVPIRYNRKVRFSHLFLLSISFLFLNTSYSIREMSYF